MSGGLEGYGPAIAASRQDEYETFGLAHLRPVFDLYPREARGLSAASRVPDPSSVSPDDPEAIELHYAAPAVDPAFFFQSYVRGVAMASRAMDPGGMGVLREALVEAGQRVLSGEGLPPIDVGLYDDFREVEARIFANGEPLSWRPLLAFAQGAFWALSLVRDPDRGRGWGSPREFVRAVAATAADLGYVPF